MKFGNKVRRLLFLLLLFAAAAAAAIAAWSDQGKVYTALEKAYFLSADEIVYIRPGLKITILDVAIPADLRPVATIQITDDQNQPLDRLGILTPGIVSTSFIMAFLPASQAGEITQYVDYSTRKASSDVTGITTFQAAADSGGTYSQVGDGVYTYRFGTVLPADYHRSLTHTLGIYATRNLEEFGLSFYVSNVTRDFVPNGSPVTQIRQIAVTSACNQCHDPLAAHGETGRRDVEICILCHQPQSLDPDTGNTVDMKVMIHKIHMGESLPTVMAGVPYQIIGFGGSVIDFSDVVFPQDIRNCTTCHRVSKQVNAWLLFPTIATCGSCHDNVDFATGANHPGGAYTDNSECASCHQPQGSFEYDASISGAHTVPYKSTQLVRPSFTILGISNTAPGQSPTLRFKITDKNGNPITPAMMGGSTGRLAATIAGPTTDYTTEFQESANGASYADGIATYQFKGTIPADAAGSFAVELEGYVNTTIIMDGNPEDTLVYRDAGDNAVQYFAVTGDTAAPRRTVVALENCDRCHNKLQLHGNNRNQIQACVMCHNPTATDISQRPAAALPPEAIDFPILIHKIHTGENLVNGYTVYGFGGSINDFSHVAFPGDRRDCVKCHVDSTFTIPLPEGLQPVVTPRNYYSPTPPISAACLACHDSLSTAAHAFVNTAPFGESCPVCHKEGAEFAVTKVHAR